MSKLSAHEAALKLASRLKGASKEIRDGIDRVSINPMEQAAAKQEKMKAKILEAIDEGKWARNLRKVSLEDWKKTMKEKGLPRIAAGIDAAVPKIEAFYNELFPYQDSAKEKIRRMPDLTIEDSAQKAAEWVRIMGKFGKDK